MAVVATARACVCGNVNSIASPTRSASTSRSTICRPAPASGTRHVPAKALGDSRILLQYHFELPAAMDRVEIFHAVPEGDRPRRLVVAVHPPKRAMIHAAHARLCMG